MTAVTVSPAAWLGLLSSARGHERAEALADALPDGSSIQFRDGSDAVLRTITTGAWTVGDLSAGTYPVVPGSITDTGEGFGTPTVAVVRDAEGVEVLRLPVVVAPEVIEPGYLWLHSPLVAGVPVGMTGFAVGVPTEDEPPQPPDPPAELEFMGVPPTISVAQGRGYAMGQHVVGGVAPLVYSATGLPADVTIDPATGIISIDSEASESTTPGVQVTVTDSESASDTATFDLTITAAPVIVELDALVTLTNRAGSPATNAPLHRVIPFRQGQIPSGQFPVAQIGGNPIASQQFIVKARHPDGSVKHGIFSAVLPTVAASASADITWAAGTNPNGAPISKAAVVSALGDTTVTISSHDDVITKTWDIADLLDDATLGSDMRKCFEWANGAVCVGYVLRDRTDPAWDIVGPEGQILTPLFEIWHWPALSATLLCVRFENSKVTGWGKWAGYKVSITGASGSEVWSHASVPHENGTGWRKRLWVQGGDPFPDTFDIKMDNEWLSSIGANYRYDPTHVIPLTGGASGKIASVGQVATRWANAGKDLYDQGLLVYRGMGVASIQTDLGPYPGPQMIAHLSGRADTTAICIADADLRLAFTGFYTETETATSSPTTTGNARTKRYWADAAQTVEGKGWPICSYGRPTMSLAGGTQDSADAFSTLSGNLVFSDPSIGLGRTVTAPYAFFSESYVGNMLYTGSGKNQSRAVIRSVESPYSATVDIENKDFPQAVYPSTMANDWRYSEVAASHLQNMFTWPFVWTAEFHYLDIMGHWLSSLALQTQYSTRAPADQYRRPALPVGNGVRAEFRPQLMIWDMAWWSPDGSFPKSFAESFGMDCLLYIEGKKHLVRDDNTTSSQWQFGDQYSGDLPDIAYESYVSAQNRPLRTWENLKIWGRPSPAALTDGYVIGGGSSGFGYWMLSYGAYGFMNGLMKGYPLQAVANFVAENYCRHTLDVGANPKCFVGYSSPGTSGVTKDFYPTVAEAMADYNHDKVEAQWPNGYNDYKPMAWGALGVLGELSPGGYSGREARQVFADLTGPYKTNNWDICWRIVPRGNA